MKRHEKRVKRRTAFTLVELLVVIAIISILVLMLLPAVNAIRESARRAQCMAKMSQIGVAFHNYEMTYDAFPSGVRNETGPILNRARGLHQSWTIAILPQLDEANLYSHIDQEVSVYDKKHAQLADRSLSVFMCPSSATWGGGTTSYAAVHHDSESPIDTNNNGVFYLNSVMTRDDISDGLRYTFFLGEKMSDRLNDLGWMSGTRATLRNTGHVIGVLPNGLAAGGSTVRDYSIDPADNPPLEPENQADPIESDPPTPDGSRTNAPAEISTDETIELNVQSNEDEAADAANTDNNTNDEGADAAAAAALAIEKAIAAGLYVGGFGSDHPGGALFVFGDGSVRFIPQSIDMNVYKNFGNRGDGQLIDNEILR